MRIALATLALLAGCAGPPPDPTPSARQAIAAADARGTLAVRSGNLEAAAREYERALWLARSVEDTDGAAASAINLSIVYQRLGREREARAALSPLLDAPQEGLSGLRRMQAELRGAILDLDAGRTAEAARWLAQAQARCRPGSCALHAAMANVGARIALRSGEPQQALALARKAAEAARRRDDSVESANALRIEGLAQLVLGAPAAALGILQAALRLDREIAEPRKIALDLDSLADAAKASGDEDAARRYRARAAAVRRAARDSRRGSFD